MHLYYAYRTLCINRNILECKGIPITMEMRGEDVLIETYWNVKSERSSRLAESRTVLIETYWNVKIPPDSYLLDVTVY